MHEHTCFTAAGAGYDQQIAERRGDRLALPIIQSIENVGDVQPIPIQLRASLSSGLALYINSRLERALSDNESAAPRTAIRR